MIAFHKTEPSKEDTRGPRGKVPDERRLKKNKAQRQARKKNRKG